jgi:dTDP-D-glucose 4,6-dehydratase
VFNIGNPHEVTMLELASTIARLAGADASLRHLPAAADDPSRRRPDITKMRERYGWEPRVSLEDGLSRTLACFTGNSKQQTSKNKQRTAQSEQQKVRGRFAVVNDAPDDEQDGNVQEAAA